MESSKKPWPLSTVNGIRDRINTQPDYQRPAVWSRSQKQLLIDTILRNYDVPKLYWYRVSKSPAKYDVVDGQQRLRAIWEYFAGEYGLPKNADTLDGNEIAGLTYSELPDELRMRFDTYPLDVVIVEDADEDEVREMFLRLQNGTTLKAQEKRNAFPGKMRAFIKTLAKHEFFGRVGFSDHRYMHDLVAAQITCLELNGGPANVKSRDLDRMYCDNPDFDPGHPSARATRRTLDLLAGAFPEKTPELTRFNVISLYCAAAKLLPSYVRDQFGPVLHDWFLKFEVDRRAQESLPEDEADVEWLTYRDKISHSTDSEESIQWRTDFMLRSLLAAHCNIQLKDDQRIFTPEQRLVVFRRDGAICQLRLRCTGVKVQWGDWHCDHRVPWSNGGRTTVENGQVACSTCNLAKGADAESAAPRPAGS